MGYSRIIHDLQAGNKVLFLGKHKRIDDILAAVQAYVEIDDVSDWYWASDKTDWSSADGDCGIQRPPFDCMWMEARMLPVESIRTADGSAPPKNLVSTAFFVQTIGHEVGIVTLWKLSGVGIAMAPWQVIYELDENGHPKPTFRLSGHAPSIESFKEQTICTYGKFEVPAPHEAMLAIGLMHCKNVQRVESDEQPPKAMRRQFAGAGKEFARLTRITLPGGFSGSRRSVADRAGAVLPLHTVRGHFKTYTNEAPLFGSRTGTYWWGWQARGNREIGTIEHVYDVKPA